MQKRSALVKAVRMWGPWAGVQERTTQHNAGRRCEVGLVLRPEVIVDGEYPHSWPFEVRGAGPSWVQAFADADRKIGGTPYPGIP